MLKCNTSPKIFQMIKKTKQCAHVGKQKLCIIFTVKNNPQYEMIFSDNISEQVKVNKIFNMIYQTRENYQTKMKNEKSESDPVL